VLERINDNAYKIDLPDEYEVSVTFNVSSLSFFDVRIDSQHLRTNGSQEGDNDIDIQVQLHNTHDGKAQVHEMKNKVQDLIQDLGGLIIRGRLTKIQ